MTTQELLNRRLKACVYSKKYREKNLLKYKEYSIKAYKKFKGSEKYYDFLYKNLNKNIIHFYYTCSHDQEFWLYKTVMDDMDLIYSIGDYQNEENKILRYTERC